MKYVGLLILAVGIGLAASYGARVTPAVQEQLTLEGAAQFRSAEADAAFAAYCEARAEAGLETADGCPDEASPGPTTETLPPAVLDARDAWIAAADVAAGAAAAASEARTPGPEERLEAWANESGAFFALGLVLIVAGALIGRAAVKREAAREPGPAEGGKGEAKEARDFGKVLDRLRDEVRALADEAKGITAPQRADYDRVKTEVDRLEAEHIEPLVASRARVQLKHGMAGFAEIFGPLSSAERKLHRAWSASVDHHWPETLASLEAAATDLVEAHDVLSRITSSEQPRS